jgi:ribosomal protein S18 acetylase RimI-like enzyme
MRIERLKNVSSTIKELVELLTDCVEDGASIGFVCPLEENEAERYWNSLNDGLADESRILLVGLHDNKIVGAVQASFCGKKNGLHRAEVEKLMVHRNYRSKGIGRKLLEAIEEQIKNRKRWLIVLDTRVGDVASNLYKTSGYTEAGQIPQFALSSAGSYEATAYFFKKLV